MKPYLVAVVSLVVAVLARWLLDPWLGNSYPVTTVYGAVAVAVYVGGYRPALVAYFGGFFACSYLFVEPRGSVWPDEPADWLGLAAYSFSCALIIGIGEALHAARRRLAEKRVRLAASEEFHRTISDLTADYCWAATVGPGGDVTTENVTEGFTKLLGYTLDDLRQTGWEIIAHPDERETARREVGRLLGGETIRGEMRHVTRDGRVVWVNYLTRPLLDGRGKVVRLVGAAQDITARKLAEEGLARSRRQFERIAAATPDLLYVFDLTENRNVYTSPSVGRVLGHPPERIAALGPDLIPALIHPDDVEGVVEGNKRFDTLADDQVYDHELRMRHADGSYRCLRCRDVVFERDADGRATKIIGTAQDVTDLKAQQEALREREEQLRLAVRAADMILFRWDIATDVVTRLGDTPADAPLGPQYTFEQAMATIHPDDLPAVRRRVDAALRGDGPELYVSEHRHNETPDGSWRWILVHGRIRRDEHGRPLVMYGLGMDITATKRAEEEARRLNRELQGRVGELQTLLDILPVGVWQADGGCERIVGNAAAYEMLGMERGVNASLTATQGRYTGAKCVAGGRELGPDELPLQRVARTGLVVKNFEHDVVFGDGRVVTTLCNAAPLYDTGGQVRGVVGVYADITERKRAETLQAGQRAVLEMVATARPLPDVLTAVCRVIEEQEPGLLCSVLLPDEHRLHIGLAVGPSLPDVFFRSIEGLRIGPPYTGSCAVVMDTGEAVVVPDVRADEDFSPEWRGLLTGHGLRACRSFPVVGADGSVLASFAIYRREPGDPAPANTELIAAATHLAAIAIGRKQAEERLRQSNERLRLIVESATDYAIFTLDTEGVIDGWNAGAERLFGYTEAEIVGQHDRLLYTPEDAAEKVPEREMRKAGAEGRAVNERWHARKDGGRFWGSGLVQPLRAEGGGVVGFLKIMRDMTEARLAEERLRERTAQLNFTLASTGVGMWLNTLPLGRLNWDDRTRALFLIPPGVEPTVELFWSRLHPDDREPTRLAIENAIRDRTLYAIDHRVVNPDTGEVRWVRSAGQATYAGDGTPTRFDGINYDITDRKHAEEQLRDAEQQVAAELEAMTRLHALSTRLLSADDITAALDDVLENAISACGAAFGNVQLYNPEVGGLEIVAHRGFRPDFLDHFRTVRVDEGSACAQAMQSGQRIVIEDVNLDPTFEPHRPVAAAAGYRAVQSTPLRGRDGAVIGMLSTHFRTPHQLSVRAGRLLDLYARHAVDLVVRIRYEQALKDADRKKDEFLATLAHELRNPLAPLRNGIQIMKLAGGDPRAVEKARSMMERQLEQMARLIDDLMDVSRISRGKIVLQKTRMPVSVAIRNAVDTSRPLIDQQGHELVVDVPDEPIYVDGDNTRLCQVFANLLNNAAKYTERGGRIRLAVERQDSDVVVAVEDTGVGIPAHLLTTVFDMFSQVDRSLERAQGGLGIGLNIVKRLVEMHGGSIVAESGGHGTGSRFVVRLPVVLTVTTDRATGDGNRKVKPAARRRILVVDDNRDGADSLAEMLNIMGNEAQTAHDGLEAVAVAEAFHPDVILMDIGMPKLNGFDACRRIREQPWGKGFVMVACTGWGQDDDKKKSQEAGFDLHMVKPVDPAELEKLLAELRATTG